MIFNQVPREMFIITRSNELSSYPVWKATIADKPGMDSTISIRTTVDGANELYWHFITSGAQTVWFFYHDRVEVQSVRLWRIDYPTYITEKTLYTVHLLIVQHIEELKEGGIYNV